MSQDEIWSTIPVGKLGIIPLRSCDDIAKKVDKYIVEWRSGRTHEEMNTINFEDYKKDSYLVNAECPRFGSGEAKGLIKETVRGDDLYFLVDVTNYSITYTVSGHENHMSPDDHFSDLKRLIAAVGGKARRITVIMPFLYEGRQHKRSARESLDCALALQDLINMGVDSIITFDAHDPRVQNAIPLNSFETVQPTYQFIKALLRKVPDIILDTQHTMVISPDEGAMSRAVYFGSVTGTDVGMFYKRRDYTKIVNGRNPIVAHEFLGSDVEGKDVIIIDDMISSGESLLDTARELKARKAKRIFLCATFGLFTNGLDAFDKANAEGIFDLMITTNLVYQTPELLARPYYASAEMAKYIALLIDAMNHDRSISEFLSPTARIQKYIEKYKNNQLNN
ncbi:MAG: ribose-phosphate pyrophosphokinase [Lachnospiraceae bacterium]|nr:ribose-phosphate pyrophosphokinase [Lachnospiraceae bacterium]